MAKNYYLPTDDNGKADLLELLASKLPSYGEILGISGADLAELKADAAAFRHTLSVINQMQNNAKQWTAYKSLVRDGGIGSATYPLLPALSAVTPEAVAPGIVPRLTALVARVKAARNYTEVIGQDLGLIGSDKVIDTSIWKPIIDTAIEAGHPVVQWNKGKADSLEIWVDRNDGAGFIFFNVATDPRVTDKTNLPSNAALWSYKGIYRLRDNQVGQWSNVHSVAVGK